LPSRRTGATLTPRCRSSFQSTLMPHPSVGGRPRRAACCKRCRCWKFHESAASRRWCRRLNFHRERDTTVHAAETRLPPSHQKRSMACWPTSSGAPLRAGLPDGDRMLCPWPVKGGRSPEPVPGLDYRRGSALPARDIVRYLCQRSISFQKLDEAEVCSRRIVRSAAARPCPAAVQRSPHGICVEQKGNRDRSGCTAVPPPT
jgi:hypothetical protein